MEKETRNAIQSATQKARRLLEEDFREQLEGVYDVQVDGTIAPKAGSHLSAREQRQRDRIVAAIEHKCAGGMKANEAVLDYLRDAAFTTINRFVALKMLEARDIVQECISKGDASSGFAEFSGLAPGIRFPDGSGYRLYLECIFDELSTEVKVLFDRRDPSVVLWPKRSTFEQLLEILNTPELSGVWGEDETIGWVYQFFNGQDERRKMREESQAPRNSRELAIRNQFFTPRYVVQFLSDNTLGRIWYEMRDGDTRLEELCEYLVRRPDETWQPRAKKDPRDVRVLDPACGSGHFLLYCFDLLLVMYAEAWADEASPASEVTGKTLREDYPEIAGLQAALPGLILRHNLHGVDIDPRCAQIGQLALWMRAQRAFKEFDIGRAERPIIKRANIVIAEPMPGEKDLLKEFLAELKEDKLEGLIRRALDVPADKRVRATKAMADSLAELVETVWDGMKLAGEMGTLLKIERDLARAIEKGRAEWEDTLPLFRVADYGLGGITNERLVRVVPGGQEDFWTKAEKLVFQALADYTAAASGDGNARRRLFAEDAAQGFALTDLVAKKFDVILMNPPFGTPSAHGASIAEEAYEGIKHDISTAFMARASDLCPSGYCGAIVTRTPFYLAYLANWRMSAFAGPRREVLFADLGLGVLDALVETACLCWSPTPSGIGHSSSTFIRLLGVGSKAPALLEDVNHIRAGEPSPRIFIRSISAFSNIPRAPFIYSASDAAFAIFERGEPLRTPPRDLYVGAATQDDFRFTRLRWELPPDRLHAWPCYSNGGRHHAVLIDVPVRIKWEDGGRELKAFLTAYRAGKGFSAHWTAALNSHEQYFRPGITWSRRPHKIGTFWSLPDRTVFGNTGLALLDEPNQLAFNLGVINSSVFLSLLSFFMPRGTEGESTTLKYELGYVAAVPFPRVSAASVQMVSSIVREFAKVLEAVIRLDERAALWHETAGAGSSATEICNAIHELPYRVEAAQAAIVLLQERLDDAVGSLYAETAGIEHASVIELSRDIALTRRGMVHDTLEPISSDEAERRIVSYLLGLIFDRWNREISALESSLPSWLFPDASRAKPRGIGRDPHVFDIFSDDEGHSTDIVAQIQAVSEDVQSVGLLEPAALRRWLAFDFFGWHLKAFSEARRKAPIYWQLATPSASYSVWLYIHTFTKDTLFRVQNDYVAGKLAHEERQLETLRAEGGPDPVTAQRKAIEAQEAFVDELRTFLDEVKRVAPLWNPNLDDGVIINFAPLWRLVPHHKPWQKELHSTWAALCAGKYDWAHLAMHLWPERVVPKCCEDRSLAIAHDLEDVFWYQDDDEKWKPREEPMRPIDALVKERTSSAVKAALKSLMEAPEQAGGARRRRGRRG